MKQRTWEKTVDLFESRRARGVFSGSSHGMKMARSSHWAYHRVKQLKERATRHELKVKRTLPAIQVKAQFQRAFLCGGNVVFVVDFYCKELNLIIEIDGRSHIGREFEDAAREATIKKYVRGVRFVRFTNAEIDANWDKLGQFMRSRLSKFNPALLGSNGGFRVIEKSAGVDENTPLRGDEKSRGIKPPVREI